MAELLWICGSSKDDITAWLDLSRWFDKARATAQKSCLSGLFPSDTNDAANAPLLQRALHLIANVSGFGIVNSQEPVAICASVKALAPLAVVMWSTLRLVAARELGPGKPLNEIRAFPFAGKANDSLPFR